MSEQVQPVPEILTGENAFDIANAILRSATNLQNKEPCEFVSEEQMYGAVEGGCYASPEIELHLEKSVSMPINIFAGAINFDSWEGRRAGHLKDDKPSKVIIDDYANRDSEIPGIEDGIDMFLANSGEVFAYSHNSHRLAAARLRGQETISARGPVRVFHLRYTPHQLQSQKDA